jgi:histidyl-tRNA synthetase
MIKRADKMRARAAVIIGGNEVASGQLTVKDLAKGTQSLVAADALEARLREMLD